MHFLTLINMIMNKGFCHIINCIHSEKFDYSGTELEMNAGSNLKKNPK